MSEKQTDPTIYVYKCMYFELSGRVLPSFGVDFTQVLKHSCKTTLQGNLDGPKLLVQVTFVLHIAQGMKRRKIFGYPVEQQSALWIFFCTLEIVGSPPIV